MMLMSAGESGMPAGVTPKIDTVAGAVAHYGPTVALSLLAACAFVYAVRQSLKAADFEDWRTPVTRTTAEVLAVLADAVRATLADDMPHVAGIMFEPHPYDDGPAFNGIATVYYTDGRDPHPCDFGIAVLEALRGLYGTVGKRAGLAFIPTTGDHWYVSNGADVLPQWIAAGSAEAGTAAAMRSPDGTVHAGRGLNVAAMVAAMCPAGVGPLTTEPVDCHVCIYAFPSTVAEINGLC